MGWRKFMKIIEKESKSKYYAVDKPCCKEMKKQLKHNITVINGYAQIHLFQMIMDNEYSMETLNINYCPWCGEKIIDEIEELLT